MLLGSRKDEDGVLRRLLQSLEEGIERRRREHMNLIDDKDRVVALLRDDTHLLNKVTDVVNRVVRCRIELVHIERASLVERATRLTLVASLATLRIETVDGLCKDSCTGGLTHATRSAEHIGVRQLSTLDGVFQGRCNMTLSHNRSEGCGAILTC